VSGLRPGGVKAAALHHPARPTEHRYPQPAVNALRCPHCEAPLSADDGQFSCANGHTFDVARHGYVALLGSQARTDTGDSPDMVAARVAFLAAGHFSPIAAAVARAAQSFSGPVLEVGAGTGYYLRAVLDSATNAGCGIAIDSSKYAARRSAVDPRTVSVVADAWSALPLVDAAAGVVLSVFAPRTATEMARVLRPDGLLVAVTPEPQHLRQLRDRLAMLTVDEGKADRMVRGFAGLLTLEERRLVEFDLTLGHADIAALVRMGPTARHLAAPELQAELRTVPDPLTITGSVTVSTFKAAAR